MNEASATDAPVALPLFQTGTCARGEHDQCRGRVYSGHASVGDRFVAQYRRCQCPCHHALPKAA